jgi:hypothetical protein
MKVILKIIVFRVLVLLETKKDKNTKEPFYKEQRMEKEHFISKMETNTHSSMTKGNDKKQVVF